MIRLRRAVAAIRSRVAAAQALLQAALRDRLRPRIAIEVVAERPARPRPHRLYVTRQQNEPAFGSLVCPCGCREVLQLRFFGHRRPRWFVTWDRRRSATVTPSIWRRSGCKSHFYLTGGRIRWCR